MNIKGIHGSGALTGANACEPRPARTPSNLPEAPQGSAAKTHISGPGQLFSRLAQLAEQDPAAFEEIAQNLSDELTTQAEGSSGRASDLAQKLADRFEQAAQSGDLSAFPAGGERGGVGRHRHHDHDHRHDHRHDHHHRHEHGDRGSRVGGGEGVRSVLERALDLVHEALQASSSPSATPPSATPPSAVPASAAPPSATATDPTTASPTTASAPLLDATTTDPTPPTTADSEV